MFENIKLLNDLEEKDSCKKKPVANITYTQAGVWFVVREESGIFEIQFFVGSLVEKIPACVWLQTGVSNIAYTQNVMGKLDENCQNLKEYKQRKNEKKKFTIISGCSVWFYNRKYGASAKLCSNKWFSWLVAV
ncbi:MAG: hypothetical protein FJZ66_07365 [Bacteroidetes bacterium]|nr:hypothetical protein [Bacteroidota bacterium]